MVNEWNKTAFVEFETMLRRRLRSGAAPVTACAGFDLDDASAYLEGALGGSHRAGYESHLAGCVTCRRHLIELARLAQTAPLAEPQIVVRPATAPDRIPAWDRWKAAVTAWFDVSSRSLKWRLAGATGAAFAILIAALGVQSWRQVFRHRDLVASPTEVKRVDINSANNSNSEPTLSETAAQPPTPEQNVAIRGEGNPATPIKQETIANTSEAQPQIPAPAPLVRPQGKALTLDFRPSNGSLALSQDQTIEGPAASRQLPMPKQASAVPVQNPHQPQITLEGLAAVSNPASIDSKHGSSEEAPKKVVLKPHGNLMDPKPAALRHGLSLVGARIPSVPSDPEPDGNTQPSKTILENLRGGMREAISHVPLIRGLTLNSEPERKTASTAQETADADPSKPVITQRIRDKVFHFEKEKGMWVDQEYKPEMDQWTRWTLKRDSKEYKEILDKDPSLTVFFERGPILVVWKNGIYKVMK
jgi:hypothetical protein